MVKLKAKDYETREDLEKAVVEIAGSSPEFKEGHVIEGTKKELKKLKLSEKNTVFGWSILQTDKEEKSKEVHTPPERGQRYKSGINKRDE